MKDTRQAGGAGEHGRWPSGAVRRHLIGAALAISVGFGIAFSSLYLVQAQTARQARLSKESLRGLAAVNQLNFQLKAITSRKRTCAQLSEEMQGGIAGFDVALQRVTEADVELAEEVEAQRAELAALWQALSGELQQSVVYLEQARAIDDQDELSVYGIDAYLDRYHHSQSGALGNPDLFALLRDFRMKITLIEHTANLFQKRLEQYSSSIDAQHEEVLQWSRSVSITIFALVTICTIAFLTVFAGTITRVLQGMVHEMQAQNRALRDRDEEIRAIMAAMPDLMFIFDREGRYLDVLVNRVDLLVAPREECIGKTVRDLFPESMAAEMEGVIDDVLRSGAMRSYEYELELNAERHWFSARLVPLEHQGQAAVLCLSRDISAHRLAEAEKAEVEARMHQIQKMEAIGNLAGGMAHDFNNMIGGIMGAAELAQRRLKRGEDPDKYLTMILEGAGRAASLTDKLLAFARKQPRAVAVVDAIQSLQDALELIRNTVDRRIHIEVDLADQEVAVVGDRSQLQTMFMNLLINASHAMPEGGEIVVSARCTELDRHVCSASVEQLEPGPYLEVEIRDTGCGIPDEDLNRIFEPFYTTKGVGQGTGLGLAAVLGTVQQHNGAIRVDSEVGSGTSFHILLPLAEGGDQPAQAPPAGEHVAGSGTILYVDDEAVMRATGSAILEELGYTVITAEDGAQALEVFSRERASIDLVILDMVMPAMNGRDCFMALKRLCPDVRVLLSSGFSREREVTEMKQAGMAGFIRKPFRGEELSRAVSDAMGCPP